MNSLVVIVDGCNKEYIDEKITPFLYNLKEKGGYSRINVTPTFAHRVEIMCGNSPLTTDTFVDFCYSPESSPFWFLKFLKPPIALKQRGRIIRSALNRLAYLISGHRTDFINIPLALLPYFFLNKSILEFGRKERERSNDHLLGILERNGFRVRFIHGTMRTITRRLENHSVGENEVLMIHYTDTDEIGHEYGPNSLEMKKILKSISVSVETIYSSGKFDFVVIFGDHNMVEVKRNIDLWAQLNNLDVKLIEDYLVFLNSPMARFWFRNNYPKKKVEEFLSSLNCGKIATKKELKEREIPTDEKYGQLIFWMKKGTNISPDFYHVSEIKGMHGYLDDVAETPLIVFHKSKEIRLKAKGKLRDIAPTILDLLDIESKPVEGKSLVIKNESKKSA